jgi:hypothetical protein
MSPALTPRGFNSIVRRPCDRDAAPLWLTGRSALNEARRRPQFEQQVTQAIGCQLAD